MAKATFQDFFPANGYRNQAAARPVSKGLDQAENKIPTPVKANSLPPKVSAARMLAAAGTPPTAFEARVMISQNEMK